MRNLIVGYIVMISVISMLLLNTMCCQPSPAFGKEEKPKVWQVIIAEAVGEGEIGMMAVACVIRNRGGDINGFAGTYREDLDEFCHKQGPELITLAKQIEIDIFENDAPDITRGATHFENIEKFGIPYWIKDMKVTCKIGDHIFYK